MYKQIILMLFSALGLYSYFETKFFKVSYSKIGNNNIRILHISDIHLYPFQKRKLKFIKKLNDKINSKNKIDLIISTGDNISSNKAISILITTLAQAGFDKIPGVFVFGSNDYYKPRISNPLKYFFGPSSRKKKYTNREKLDTDRLKKGFEFLGWKFVENNNVNLKIKNKNLSIIGGPDYHLPKNRIFYKNSINNHNSKNKPSQQNHLNLAVTHAPYLEVLNYFLNKNVNYIFSGHTHGGQICLPKFGSFLTNCDLPREYSKGVFKVKNSYISISQGLGTVAFFPFRFFCPPGVTILEI
jgi:predicted MPP superfamily phosphohydrolase